MQTILKNAPMGSNPRQIMEKLIERGYNIEGMDTLATAAYRAQKQEVSATAGNQFEEAAKPKTFWGKARDFAAKVVGGGELARGAGMALAAPTVQRSIDDALSSLTEQQTNLITEIRKRRTRGEDVSRLENALRLNQSELAKISDTASDFAEALPTNKQVIGSAARLAGTAAGGALAGGASKLTGAGRATGFLSGAVRGAGAGAITGAAEGAIQGTGLAAEADKSTEELLLSGALGAVSGALIGGAVGTLTGGIGGAVRGRKIRNEQFAQELVSPKQTAKVRAEAIRQGRLQDPGFFKKAELAASKRDLQLADAVDDVISPKATVGENIDSIRYKINQTNSGVKSYITRNKVPFNMNQVRSRLENGKEDLRLIFASDTTAERTYDAVVDAFMNNVKKGDTLGLFEARQTVDKIPAIKKLLDSRALGENVKKEIVLTVRRSANDYIASLLPEGNQYRQLLLNESYMIEALGNIADKASSIVGKNRLQILSEQYPALKWIVGAAAAGAAGAAGVGVGGAVIGSTD